jgi:NDP-sugar pyrophosphorylase family protein
MQYLKKLSEVTAVILAGGLGTRLRPVVADRPKVLAEVSGRPFLAYLLDQLVQVGLTDVVLCTGYLGEQVEAAFRKKYHSLHLSYSKEPVFLGTGGALRLALPLLKSDSALVMNGDSFCGADLTAFWLWHLLQKANCTLLLSEATDRTRYGRVAVDGKGRVVRFIEKDGHGELGWINAGIYLIRREFLLAIPEGGPVSLEREVFPSWVGRGLFAYMGQGRFIDIGIPEAYAEAGKVLAMEAGR